MTKFLANHLSSTYLNSNSHRRNCLRPQLWLTKCPSIQQKTSRKSIRSQVPKCLQSWFNELMVETGEIPIPLWFLMSYNRYTKKSMLSIHKYQYWDEGMQKPWPHQGRDGGAAIAASSSANATEMTKRVNGSLISNWCTAIASTTAFIPHQATLRNKTDRQ